MNTPTKALSLIITALCLSLTTAYAQTSFTMDVSQGCVPLTVTFTNTSTAGSTYLIDFGDGYSGYWTGTDTSHTYMWNGNFQVNLYGYDSLGSYIGSSYNLLEIYQQATDFYMSDTAVCPGSEVGFNGDGLASSFLWDFGDGDSASGQWANHAYTTLGVYNVTLITTGICGIDTIVQGISVDSTGIPNAEFGFWPDPVCPLQPVNFYPYANDGTDFYWDFGDATTSTSQYPTHSYSTLGFYPVTFAITNGCGNTDTSTAQVEVKDDAAWPALNLSFNSPVCPGEEVGTNAPGGYLAYVFNPGDGSPSDSTTESWHAHTYSSLGAYIQSVRIYDYCGRDTILYGTVIVSPSVGLPNQPWFEIQASDLVCPGEETYMNAPGGYMAYVWDFADGSPADSSGNDGITHTFDTAGTYVISVKVYNFCGNDSTLYATVVVDDSAGFQPSISIGFQSPICPGGAQFNAPAGMALYVWDYGDGSPVDSITYNNIGHTYLDTGSFPIMVTLVNFCGDDTTLSSTLVVGNNIGFPMNMEVNSYPDPVCPGDRVNLGSEYGYASYDWDFGDGYTITTGSDWAEHYYDSLGTYSYSVTITNGCGMDTTLTGGLLVSANAPVPPQIELDVSSSTICPGDAVNFSIDDDWALFFWDFGDGDTLTTTQDYLTHVYDTVGTFEASVTISNGCGNQLTLKTTIVVDSNNTFVDVDMITLNDNVCPGDIVALGPNNSEGLGGTSYTYYWNLGDGTLDTTQGVGLNHSYDSTGVYTVNIIGTNACGFSDSSSLTITVTDSAFPNLGIPGGNDDGIFGVAAEGSFAGCPGDAVLFYFAGIYTNTWDFGDGSSGSAVDVIQTSFGAYSSITHVYQDTGSYWAKLTLTNGCANSASDSIMIIIGSGLAVDGDFFAESPDGGGSFTTCQGVGFLAYGGTSYTWDYGDGATVTTNSAQVTHYYDSAGTYTVTVTMTNSCGNTASYTQQITVVDGGGASASAMITAQLTCNGGADAVATAAGTGGSLPYTYLWDDPLAQSTAIATDLGAGTYTVLVSDNLGCAGSASITIADPPMLIATASMTPASCATADGTVSITTTTGGTGPYTYAWDNGDTTATADSLASGTYTVTITDSNSCQNTQVFTLNDVGGTTISGTTVTDATCNGGSDGAVAISVSGGTTPYTYAWSNGDTIEDVTGLKEGTYTVTVTDSAGCKTIESATVSEPLPIALATTIADANCGVADGSIVASVSGGTPGYEYLWSNAVTTSSNSGLVAGAYTLTITDTNSCTATYTVIVSNANSPEITAVVDDLTCNGSGDGAIDLTVSGGTTPYTYLWLHNGSFIQDVSGLDANSYTVILNDGGGCQTAQTFSVTEPDVLAVNLAVSGEHCNSSDGWIAATATGGTEPYTYSWTSGGSSSSITGLADGPDTVNIADANSCTVSSNTTVSDIPGPSVSISDSSMVLCFGDGDGTATALAVAGTGDYTYTWNDLNSQSNAQATDLDTGTYQVMVVDSAGCADSASVTITQPNVLTASISTIANTSCFDTCDGSATVTITGGTSPYAVLWGDGQVTIVAVDLCDGGVDAVVTDTNGCVTITTGMITEPSMIVLSTTETNISCAGGNDGSIDLTMTGGTAPYTYNWSNSDTTEDVSNLTFGTYEVIATDTNGCQDSITVSLTEEAPLVLTTSNVDAHCGQTDGSVSVGVSGGVAPYTYAWDDPGAQITAAATGLPDDVYHVTVMDSFGCVATDSATVSTTVDSISICVVTVDSTSSMNVVVWDKPSLGLGISSVNVYRDVIGNYTLIGNVAYDSLSLFEDLDTINANPNSLSYSYKISIVDSCANEGPKSDFHKTINLAPVNVIGGDATLIWDNYQGFNFAYYRIMRNTKGFDSTWVAIDSVTNSVFIKIDIGAPQVSKLSYRVDVVTASVCLAEKGKNFNSSKSNTSSFDNKDYMTAAVTTTDQVQDSCTGTATIVITDGTAPYTYLWDDGLSQTTATATGLCAGIYNVTVYDADGDSIVGSGAVGTISGFNEFDLGTYLVIYPNPNTGQFSILITIPQLDLATLKVFTIEGQLVIENALPGIAGELRTDLDLSGEGPGVYYVQVVSARGTSVKKVVVQ